MFIGSELILFAKSLMDAMFTLPLNLLFWRRWRRERLSVGVVAVVVVVVYTFPNGELVGLENRIIKDS